MSYYAGSKIHGNLLQQDLISIITAADSIVYDVYSYYEISVLDDYHQIWVPCSNSYPFNDGMNYSEFVVELPHF